MDIQDPAGAGDCHLRNLLEGQDAYYNDLSLRRPSESGGLPGFPALLQKNSPG